MTLGRSPRAAFTETRCPCRLSPKAGVNPTPPCAVAPHPSDLVQYHPGAPHAQPGGLPSAPDAIRFGG